MTNNIPMEMAALLDRQIMIPIAEVSAIAVPARDFSISVHHLAEALGEAVDIKDQYTHHHSQEVAVISFLLARAIGLEEASCTAVHIAGHLHDLGKIGISDLVLQKNGPLTAAEWAEMRQHPQHGYNILHQIPGLSATNGIAEMVLSHHERFDGGGYPQGLQGTAIPLGSRILAVADTISAMTGKRSYRKPLPWDKVITELKRVSGTQLDPFMIDIFLTISEQIYNWLLSENEQSETMLEIEGLPMILT